MQTRSPKESGVIAETTASVNSASGIASLSALPKAASSAGEETTTAIPSQPTSMVSRASFASAGVATQA